jgi:Holliday junction resolvase
VRQWQDRKAIGDAHEQRVAAALRARGWTVHPCGQGTYPPAVRDALRRTRSALRQFPDLIAARGADLITIDAKDRMPSTDTDRYAISTDTVNAGLLFTAAHAPTPLYYVFGDLKVLTPAEVVHYTVHALRHRSGVYHLVGTARAHRFDEVFGSAGTAAAA